MVKYCIDFPSNDRILFVHVLCIGVFAWLVSAWLNSSGLIDTFTKIFKQIPVTNMQYILPPMFKLKQIMLH